MILSLFPFPLSLGDSFPFPFPPPPNRPIQLSMALSVYIYIYVHMYMYITCCIASASGDLVRAMAIVEKDAAKREKDTSVYSWQESQVHPGFIIVDSLAVPDEGTNRQGNIIAL